MKESRHEKIRELIGQYEIETMQNDLATLQNEFGLTEVEGAGITVLLDDNQLGAQAANSGDLNLYIIHYENILSEIKDSPNHK